MYLDTTRSATSIALDLPEILELIASFLSSYRHFTACSLVCKIWNEKFSIGLYGYLKIFIGTPPITLAGAIRHKTLVHKLELFTNIDTTLYPLPFDRLRTLTIEYRSPFCTNPTAVLSVLPNFIRQNNTTLQDITLSNMDDSFAFNIWEAISTCSKLDKIRFHKCHLLRAKEKLVDAIKHARILRVTYTYYDFKGIKPPLTTTSPPRLPNLQSLDILRSREYSCSGDISPIIQHAPNLVSLKMDPQLAPDPASYMHELSVSISGCPKLQDIKLDHMTLLKEETTMVLDAITDAKRLDWGVGEISEQAFRSIMSRHARTITHLHLSESPGLTSSMAQTIMISCSLLESLKLSTISGTNLVRINTVDQGNQSSSKNTGRLILGEDWICLRLRALKLQLDLSSITMNIDRDTPEGESLFQRQQQLEQYHAFRQIGRLTLLQDLNISESQYDTRNKRSLDLRLGENGGGLEGLAALKKLNTIKFRNTKQELSEKEIGWMISNWLHLYRIGGTYHPDSAKNANLAKYANEKIIECR